MNFCMSAPGFLHCGAQHAKRQQQRKGKNNRWFDMFFLFYPSSFAFGSLGSCSHPKRWQRRPKTNQQEDTNVLNTQRCSKLSRGLIITGWIVSTRLHLQEFNYLTTPSIALRDSDNIKMDLRQSKKKNYKFPQPKLQLRMKFGLQEAEGCLTSHCCGLVAQKFEGESTAAKLNSKQTTEGEKIQFKPILLFFFKLGKR